MISPKDKCLFVHIPKVAGQSIESVFVERMGLSWEERTPLLLKSNKDKDQGPPRLAHLTAEEYLRCGHISQSNFEHYFKFSFVRNPWDRLVSEYNYRKQLGFPSYQNSFRDFVLNHFPVEGDDNYEEAKDTYRHIMPQYDFLYDDTGECLVNFVGRFESLQADFEYVCKALEMPVIALEHKNKTGALSLTSSLLTKLPFVRKNNAKKHYSEYYDSDTYDFVAKYYASDIEAFNYKFEQQRNG